MAHFVNDGLSGVLPLTYQPLVTLYGVSVQIISILTFLQNAFSIVASPLIGRRSDETGSYSRMIALGLIVLAVGVAGYAVSELFSTGTDLITLLVLSTVLVGVGGSFYHPLGGTVLRAQWGVGELGRAMGINGSAGSIGRIVMPLAATILITEFLLPSVSLLAGLSLGGVLISLIILRNLRFANHRSEAQKSLLPDWKLTRRLLPLTIVSFSRGLFTGVLPFIPLYLSTIDNFSPFVTGLLYSATLGVGIVSQLLFGFMQDRFGPKFSLAFSNLGGVVVLFIFAITSNPIIAIPSLVLFGLFSYSAFPLLLGLVYTMTEFDEMTSAGSIVWGIGMTGGSAITPLLIGALALPMFFGTLEAGFLCAAAIGILSIALMPYVQGAKRGPKGAFGLGLLMTELPCIERAKAFANENQRLREHRARVGKR